MKALQSLVSLLFLDFSMLVVACGGKDSSDAAPIAREDVPAKLVASYCTGYGNCCKSKHFTFNSTACQSNLTGLFTVDNVCPAPSVFDPQAAGECLAQLQEELSSCSTSGKTADVCNLICHGDLAPGSACNATWDCAKVAGANMLCMPSANSGAQSVCVPLLHGKAGDSCQATCTGGSTSGTGLLCQARAPGFDAAGTLSCYETDGLYCSSNSICKPLLAAGSPCSVMDADYCANDSYCSSLTDTCTRKIDQGSSCFRSAYGPSEIVCADGSYCSAAGTCDAKKPAGESCQTRDECTGFCDLDSQMCMDHNSTDLYVSPTEAACANPQSGNPQSS